MILLLTTSRHPLFALQSIGVLIPTWLLLLQTSHVLSHSLLVPFALPVHLLPAVFAGTHRPKKHWGQLIMDWNIQSHVPKSTFYSYSWLGHCHSDANWLSHWAICVLPGLVRIQWLLLFFFTPISSLILFLFLLHFKQTMSSVFISSSGGLTEGNV
jgi:hypothetical protein